MHRALAIGLGLSLAALFGAGSACTAEDAAEPYKPAVLDGGTTPPGDAGDASKDPDGDGGNGDGAAPGPLRLLLGVTANAAGDAPSPAAETAALLTTFAAGTRVVVVSRTLDAIAGATHAELAKEAALYAGADKEILFNLALVDRVADQRPESLTALAWDDAATVALVNQAIDSAIAAFGARMATLTLGRDVDAYLAEHPSERQGFASLATLAMGYARSRQGGLRAGVAFSHLAAITPDPSFETLLSASDIAAVSLVPGLGGEPLLPSSGIAAALDSLIAAADGKPIVLQAVGTSSSAEAGSSPELQALFFDTLFTTLWTRRGSFAIVNVQQLSDLSPAACDDAATRQGEPVGGAFAAHACALGLFDEAGESKPAWLSVLGGAATFASP